MSLKSELYYWLALLRIYGLGPIYGQRLLKAFPKIADIFIADRAALLNLGISNAIIDNIKNPPQTLIEKDLKWLEQPNHHLITLQNDYYPSLLKEIYDAPLMLLVNGDPKILNNQQVAIVGSRHPTYTGGDCAYNFAKQLAMQGITITSGLALGIDGESHKGALDAPGKTISVLGTGLDNIYPQKNHKLADKIIEQGGAIISEFVLETVPNAHNFPRRNRIISGLSLGVLIVEATMRSGSLITARLAIEQGREVFAVPGSIKSQQSKGCHHLIRQGAKLVENINDIIEELNLSLEPGNIIQKQKPLIEESILEKENLENIMQKLLKYIEYNPTPIDILIEYSNLSAQDISRYLLTLELQGIIKKTYGGYIKN